jgi:hypothetical protein
LRFDVGRFGGDVARLDVDPLGTVLVNESRRPTGTGSIGVSGLNGPMSSPRAVRAAMRSSGMSLVINTLSSGGVKRTLPPPVWAL